MEEPSEPKPVEAPSNRMKRTAVIWRCSSTEWAYPKGKTPKDACGRLNSQWTTFDPTIGGDRNHRWLGRCPCGKTTALNPESGNIVKVFENKKEGIECAETMNALEQMKQQMNRNPIERVASPSVTDGWF